MSEILTETSKVMNAKIEKARILWPAVGLLVGICAAAPGQQTPSGKPNELVVGKLVYVEPMSNDLDQWIIDFLRRWGKYKVTSNPEGVDLVIQAEAPEKELKLQKRAGTAEPRGAGRPRLPISKGEHEELPAISITVIDWVSNQPLWQADILDRKQKKNEADPPAGPLTKIFARSMTSDQLAMKITQKLKEYEVELERNGGMKH